MDQRRKKQVFGVLLTAFMLMFMVSLIGHRGADDVQITSDEAAYGNPFGLSYQNPGGMMGAYLSYVILLFFGWSAYPLALFLILLAITVIGLDIARRALKHAILLWTLVFEVMLLFDISPVANQNLTNEIPEGGGWLGQAVVRLLIKIIGSFGSYIFVLAGIICTIILYTAISHRFRNAMATAGRVSHPVLKSGLKQASPWFERAGGWLGLGHGEKPDALEADADGDRKMTSDGTDEETVSDRIVVDPSSEENGKPSARRRLSFSSGKKSGPAEEIPLSADSEKLGPEAYVPPSVELLSEGSGDITPYDEKELAETAQTLRETLETFGVKLSGSIDMFPGPVITRFEIKPAAGVKVNQIANLSEDLALNLKAKSIRIVAPIPGKAAIGIEIPNKSPQMVYLREIIASEAYQTHDFYLPLALGKDISGKPFVTDLAAMPHLLVAGTTGSGKSVCINVMITSLIYSLHPERLKFIFVDPKMLELSVYKGIPYLNEAVVTNPKQAERVLGDVVAEMEHRYKLLAAESVRNIVDFNNKRKQDSDRLPYIVIIIDELADLMMSAQSSRVELLITRLAQMARAVGIHLILATQRPSVDVITGLIKANFPSRIAFQVATKTDSRTILDGNGAERLLGNGDMLFLPSGSPEPIRLHGAFVSSGETENLVSFIREQTFSRARVQQAEVAAEERAQTRQFDDPVLLEAVETVIRQGQASVSLLQRKLGIGYQRAARLIDELEDLKVIGPYNESKARDILVDRSYLDSLKSGKIDKS